MKLIIELSTPTDDDADLFFTGLHKAVEGDPRLAGNLMVAALDSRSTVRVAIDSGTRPLQWREL